MQKSLKVLVVGSAGYTGGELLRLLLQHPHVAEITAHSKSNSGKYIYEVHRDLFGDTELKFSDQMNFNADVIFLCMGHHESKRFLAEYALPSSVRIIDLSQDFRDESEGFIYGLPEAKKEKIQLGQRIANPGCFATAIQLALLPLAKSNLLHHEIHVSAITGSTGAGQSLSDTVHFTWRNNNMSTYKTFEHQHLKEIKQTLAQLQGKFEAQISFIPYRGDFTRGIIASVYTEFEGTLEEAKKLYDTFYAHMSFTFVSTTPIDLKQVVNTNKCLLHLEKHGNKLLITSCIDNLTKGASGQAIQNMNILFGYPEKTGLYVKPIAF